MKRKLYIIAVCIAAAALSLSALACGRDNFAFPATAEEEYERIYTVSGGKPFDFDTIKTFSATQTLQLYIPSLTDLTDNNGNPAYPTTEWREYKWDARSGIKSQVTDKTVFYNTLTGDNRTVPQYNDPTRAVFAIDALSRPVLDYAGNQLDKPVAPVRYDSYDAYMHEPESFDADMQRITHYPTRLFESMTGKRSEDGATYSITAKLKNDADTFLEFFDLFAEEYSFRDWYTQAEGGDTDTRVYVNFLDPRFFSSVELSFLSEKAGLRSVTVTIRAYGTSPTPLEGVGAVTMVATTKYSTASTSVGGIKVPAYM